MLKFLFLFSTLIIGVYAQDTIEIYTTSMETKKNIVKAYDGVNVVYQDYILTSDSAIYNKNSGELELNGNVRASNGIEYKILGNTASLNIAKKEKSFQPFFMLDNKSEVWISANLGQGKDKKIDIESGIVSGCDPSNPLWKMEFTSSDYNTDTKWLNLYNARLYIYDIPVFYTPYFGRSLTKERKTGLLTPKLGLSNNEGFYYEQPIFIASQTWWDLELKPQIRTSRGSGIYSTFRFVDSITSDGEISLGYFKEKDNFFSEQKLANNNHYGFNIKYNNNDFMNQWFDTSLLGKSGLYLDIKNMNDIDYINLSNSDISNTTTATQLLSQMNLFYNTDDNYVGIYFKYYKDLTIDTNEDTLQILPTLHYHHYIESFFKDHLLYDVDIQANNIVRDTEINAIQTNLNIPLTLQTELFNEYLNLSYTSHIFGQYSSFYINSTDYNNGLFARQYNTVEVSSQVTRAYENFSHAMSLSTKYTLAGLESTNGYYEDNQKFCSNIENKNNARCDFYNITDVDESLQAEFTQYFFDTKGKQVLYHRLAQVLADKDSNLGELENEIDYQITNSVNLYNNMFYNYDEDKLSKLLNKISYKDNSFDVTLSHLFKDTFVEETTSDSSRSSYITSSARYTYDTHYSYKVKLDYDLETSLKKSEEIGFLYKKRCWEFGLKYVENNRPVLTNDNKSSSVYDRYIYFTIVFKPFMRGGDTSIDMELPTMFKGS